MNLPIAFIGGIGYPEMLLLGFVGLLLFGKKLPELARSLGKGVTEFKKGVQGIDDEIRDSVQHTELPHSTETLTPQAPKFEPPTSPPVEAAVTSSPDATGGKSSDQNNSQALSD